jgi:hypothetical protein
MPKFLVGIGRLVREQTTVVVEAPSAEAIDVDQIYDQYEGASWEPDQFWGAEPSESHDGVMGPAPDDAAVDVTIEAEPEIAPAE